MMLEICLFFVFLSTLFYWYMTKDFGFFDGQNIRVSKPSFPFGSHVMKLILTGQNNIMDFPRLLASEFPDEKIIGYFATRVPRFLVNDTELAKHILIKDFDHFVDRSPILSGNKIHQNFLINLQGAEWKRMRSLMSGVFTSGKLRQMFPNLLAAGQNFERYVEGVCADGAEVDMKTVGGYLTLDSIASAGFGIDTNTFAEPEHLFRVMALRLTDAPGYIKGNMYVKFAKMIFCKIFPYLSSKVLKVSIFDEEAMNFFGDIIKRSYKQRMNSQEKRRNDLIDLIVDELKKFNEEESAKDTFDDEFEKNAALDSKESLGSDFDVEMVLIANAVLFFFAGFDTSATGFSIVCHSLCMHQDMQDKVRQEIIDVFGEDDDDFTVTFDRLKELKYMDSFISESLRTVELFTFIERVCTKNYRVPGTDVVIPRGKTVFLYTKDVQEDEKNFVNAKEFDPANFDPENSPNKFAFQVFGQGPRNCIGMRYALLILKIGLVHMLRKHRIIRGSTMKDELKLTGKLNEFEGGVPVTFQKLD